MGRDCYLKGGCEFYFGMADDSQLDKLRVVPSDSDELRELLERKEAGKSEYSMFPS